MRKIISIFKDKRTLMVIGLFFSKVFKQFIETLSFLDNGENINTNQHDYEIDDEEIPLYSPIELETN